MATKQRDIFNQFKAVQSASSLPAYDSPASVSMDNMDITDFLFELIKQTKGQEGLKNIVLKSTLSELNNSMDINTTIFNILKDVFFCLFDVIIPEELTTAHNGFFINLNEIDPLNMLSVDPNSPEGKHIYEGNDPQKYLNALVYSAFATEGEVVYSKNINGVSRDIFSLSYVGGNQMKMHIGSTYANQKLSMWAEDYLQDVSFFNMANFTAQLIDIVTGVVSIKTGQNAENSKTNAKIQQVMKKLFGFCKNDQPSGNETDADNAINEEFPSDSRPQVSPKNFLKRREDNNNVNYTNLFDFTPDDLLNIENIANLLSQGKVRFSACGNFEVQIDPDYIFNKLDALFADALLNTTIAYTNENGEMVTTQEYDNTNTIPNIENTANFLTDIIKDNTTDLIDSANATAGDENASTSSNSLAVNLPNMEANFELNVIKAIPYALVQLIISPQLLLLIKTASVTIGEEENDGVFTIESVMQNLSKVITKIGDDIWNNILKNIFNILKKELTNIISDLATKYLSQRFSDYLGILTFLINLIKGLKLDGSSCQSMLDIIMKLLSLNYFIPAPPIPPPLVYVSGFLKPGLNQVSVVNDLKSQLTDKGIEVGATMSDGSPNYLMAALETQTKVLISHIKTDSKIDVMVNGIAGPAIGSAQIS